MLDVTLERRTARVTTFRVKWGTILGLFTPAFIAILHNFFLSIPVKVLRPKRGNKQNVFIQTSDEFYIKNSFLNFFLKYLFIAKCRTLQSLDYCPNPGRQFRELSFHISGTLFSPNSLKLHFCHRDCWENWT